MIPPLAVTQWRPLAEKYAGVVLDPDEILAIIWSESSGDANAVNPADPSYGLMQITLPIAKHFAGITDKAILMDPDKNVKVGSMFLSYLKGRYADKFPNCAWVAMYNAGEPKVLEGYKDPDYVNAFVSHLTDLKGATV